MIKVYWESEGKYIYFNPNHIVLMYPIKGLTLVELIGDMQFRVKETTEEILALINKK